MKGTLGVCDTQTTPARTKNQQLTALLRECLDDDQCQQILVARPGVRAHEQQLTVKRVEALRQQLVTAKWQAVVLGHEPAFSDKLQKVKEGPLFRCSRYRTVNAMLVSRAVVQHWVDQQDLAEESDSTDDFWSATMSHVPDEETFTVFPMFFFHPRGFQSRSNHLTVAVRWPQQLGTRMRERVCAQSTLAMVVWVVCGILGFLGLLSFLPLGADPK